MTVLSCTLRHKRLIDNRIFQASLRCGAFRVKAVKSRWQAGKCFWQRAKLQSASQSRAAVDAEQHSAGNFRIGSVFRLATLACQRREIGFRVSSNLWQPAM